RTTQGIFMCTSLTGATGTRPLPTEASQTSQPNTAPRVLRPAAASPRERQERRDALVEDVLSQLPPGSLEPSAAGAADAGLMHPADTEFPPVDVIEKPAAADRTQSCVSPCNRLASALYAHSEDSALRLLEEFAGTAEAAAGPKQTPHTSQAAEQTG